MQNKLLKNIGALVIFVVLFVAVSFAAHTYKTELAAIVDAGGVGGVLGFIVLTAIFVVFVIPLDVIFLIPVGVAVWGPVPTALMSITGWTLGAAVAFGIARVFGVNLVGKFIGLERVRAVQQRIPKRRLFGTVILLRLLISVDILSYALGLFSTLSWGQYILATFIGVAPFGFYFAFMGTLPFWYQLGAILVAIILTTIVVFKYA